MTDYTDASWSADDLEFKAVSGQLNVDEARGIVECFVAAVGNKDSVGDIVAPGAFDGSLRRRKPRVVWGHDWNQPIGKVLAIEEVPSSDSRLPEKMQAARVGGLLARVQFNLKSERGREAFYSVAFFGTDQEWSIGYKTIKAAYDPTAQANVLQEVELFEVSPVLHGANQLTGTISIKSMHGDMGMDESEYSNDPKGYDSEWSDWTNEDDSWDASEADEGPAEDFVGRRRVRMVVGDTGIGEIHSGSNRHQVSLDELNNDGSSINGEDRPGLGNAVSKAVNSSIQMRITQPNFVIFDMASEDGDVDTFFMPYHYDAQGGQYMFGDSMEVEVEMNVKFGMGSDEEYESEGKSAYDPALSADDIEDLEEKGLLGRIGRGIVPGGGDNPLRGRNPKDVVDRNNDGWLFSGPNRIRAVERDRSDDKPLPGGVRQPPLRARSHRLRTDATGNLVRNDNGNFITDDPTVHRSNLPPNDPSVHGPFHGAAPKNKPGSLTSNRMIKPGTVVIQDKPFNKVMWRKPPADKPNAVKLWEFDHDLVKPRPDAPKLRPILQKREDARLAAVRKQERKRLVGLAEKEDRNFKDPGGWGVHNITNRGSTIGNITSNRMEKPKPFKPKDNPGWKKPSADKPAALALWGFDNREFDIHAPIGSQNPVFATRRREELLRAAKLEDPNFEDMESRRLRFSPLTSNRMEKPGKATVTEFDGRPTARVPQSADKDAAKVSEALGYEGNGWKETPGVQPPAVYRNVVPTSFQNTYDGPPMASGWLTDVIEEGDVITFGEPGKDAMSAGVLVEFHPALDSIEEPTGDDWNSIDGEASFVIRVTHFDGVPLRPEDRHMVTVGGTPDPSHTEIDLQEFLDTFRVHREGVDINPYSGKRDADTNSGRKKPTSLISNRQTNQSNYAGPKPGPDFNPKISKETLERSARYARSDVLEKRRGVIARQRYALRPKDGSPPDAATLRLMDVKKKEIDAIQAQIDELRDKPVPGRPQVGK